MRWNTRSAPVRSTRTAMPGNLASNALAIFSASGRSTEVYHTTLPSFFAASTSDGMIALAGGTAASTRLANCGASAAPSAVALEAFSRPRRDQISFFIWVSSIFSLSPALSGERAAAFRRQQQPDRAARRDIVLRPGNDAELGAVLGLDDIIPAAAEKD